MRGGVPRAHHHRGDTAARRASRGRSAPAGRTARGLSRRARPATDAGRGTPDRRGGPGPAPPDRRAAGRRRRRTGARRSRTRSLLAQVDAADPVVGLRTGHRRRRGAGPTAPVGRAPTAVTIRPSDDAGRCRERGTSGRALPPVGRLARRDAGAVAAHLGAGGRDGRASGGRGPSAGGSSEAPAGGRGCAPGAPTGGPSGRHRRGRRSPQRDRAGGEAVLGRTSSRPPPP